MTPRNVPAVPAVSVVVICFNDADHLATAVRSVTAQTFRDLEVIVVDDASTDATPTVASSLAAADPRVSYLRLDENSGGCSRPRNAGVEAATGDYVTFLDSDDVLPRRAVSRLLRAAERNTADLTCGRLLRRHHDPVRYLPSHPDLYGRAEVLRSIEDRPRQLFDTPAVAKLYRRSFLREQKLEFPEGLLFEDLLFTAQAYCSARPIAIVPDLVYVWNVRRNAQVLSITNRGDVRGWRDRFEIHRRIDAFLGSHDVAPEVVEEKWRKFLSSDLVVFLRALRSAAVADRADLTALAHDYLQRLPAPARTEAAPGPRAAAALAAHSDLPRLLAAADYVVTGGVQSDLVVAGRRLLWTGAYPESADALDITETGLLDADFASTPFLANTRAARWAGDALEIDAHVGDVLQRLGPPNRLRGRLLVSGRVGGTLLSTPLRLMPGRDGVDVHGSIDVRKLGRRLGRPAVGHELRLVVELERDDVAVRRPLSGRDADLPAADAPLPTPWRALVGDHVRLAEVNGRLVLQLSSLPALPRRLVTVGSWSKYVALLGAARARAVVRQGSSSSSSRSHRSRMSGRL